MDQSLTQPLWEIIVPLAATSVIGVATYFWISLAYEKIGGFVESLSLPSAIVLLIIVLPVVAICAKSFPPSILVFLTIVLLSMLSAKADREIDSVPDIFSWHYWKILTASMVALCLSFLSIVGLNLIAASGLFYTSAFSYQPIQFLFGFIGCWSGVLFTPLFLWALKKDG